MDEGEEPQTLDLHLLIESPQYPVRTLSMIVFCYQNIFYDLKGFKNKSPYSAGSLQNLPLFCGV